MRDEGDHLTSAHLCLAAIEHAGHPFRHAITDDPLDDPLVLAAPDASDAELPAISALLLASVQRTCNNTAAASALLDAALAADLPDDLHAHLLIEHARLMLASGDASRAAREVADVLTFCPAAAAIALARDIESAAPSQPVALLLTQLRRHLVAAEKAADLDAQFLSTAHAICLCHKLGYTQQAAALTRRAIAASFAAPYTQLAVAHRYAQAELSPDKTLHEAAPQLRGDLTRYLAVPIRPPASLVYYQSVEAARTATDPLQAAALAVRAIRSATSPTRYRLAMPAYELIASAAPRAPHAQQALAQLLLHEEASSASPDQATNSRAAQFRRMLAEHFLAELIDSIRPDPQPTASR
jgi:hypothetical protein